MVCPWLASGWLTNAIVVCRGPPLLMSVCPGSLLPVLPAPLSNSQLEMDVCVGGVACHTQVNALLHTAELNH